MFDGEGGTTNSYNYDFIFITIADGHAHFPIHDKTSIKD